MGHEIQDAVSLELGRRIADGLPDHPEWLELARTNLERWSRLNHDAPSLLRCYNEWTGLLNRPLSEVRAILTATTDEGQRLRQNSPFAGVFSPAEVWEIKARHRGLTRALPCSSESAAEIRSAQRDSALIEQDGV